MGSLLKLENFIKDIRSSFLQQVDQTNASLILVVKECFSKQLSNEAMKADKIRSKLDLFRNKFSLNNPLLQILNNDEKKQFNKKGFYKQILLMLEIFLIECSSFNENVNEILWSLKENTSNLQLTQIIDILTKKMGILEESMDFYDHFLQDDHGKSSDEYLKEQFTQFFDEKDMEDLSTLIDRSNLNEIESKNLAHSDLIPNSTMVLDTLPEDDPNFFLTDNIDNFIKIENEAFEPQNVTKSDSTIQQIENMHPTALSPPTSIKPTENEKDKVINESFLAHFFRENFNRSIYDERIKAFLLFRGEELKRDNIAQDSLVGLYKDMLKTHPEWKITPKRFLKIVKSLVKMGLIAHVDKLETGFYMVQFQPIEMTEDPSLILQYARTTGVLTKEEIMAYMKWTAYRTETSLNFLVKSGLAKIDRSYLQGKRFYFVKF